MGWKVLNFSFSFFLLDFSVDATEGEVEMDGDAEFQGGEEVTAEELGEDEEGMQVDEVQNDSTGGFFGHTGWSSSSSSSSSSTSSSSFFFHLRRFLEGIEVPLVFTLIFIESKEIHKIPKKSFPFDWALMLVVQLLLPFVACLFVC